MKGVVGRAFATISWIITFALMGVIVYIQHLDTAESGTAAPGWNTVQRVLYETLSRDGWALAMAWIVYACNHGYAGVYLSS